MTTLTKPPDVRRYDVPDEYKALHKYLDGRFADTVVLTFADLEALLGFALPAAARDDPAWWSNPDGNAVCAPHCGTWITAHRIARPNLPARIVRFDRTPD